MSNPLMKFTQISLALALVALCITGCTKETITGTSSSFLTVEEKNEVLYFHYSHVDSINSGDIGYTTFSAQLESYDSLHVLATITGGLLDGSNNDTIYTSHMAQYGILTLPFYQSNLGALPFQQAIINHTQSSTVVANAAYELNFDDPSKIVINTTTQFFEDLEDSVFLSVYVIVDSIVANQAGHPDGASTIHRKVVADIGRLDGFNVPKYHGYKVASGVIEKGYKFNLTFEADRQPTWTDTSLISVGLVITTRDATGKPVFVNAHTQH
jgi:hypothetical protein